MANEMANTYNLLHDTPPHAGRCQRLVTFGQDTYQRCGALVDAAGRCPECARVAAALARVAVRWDGGLTVR